MKELLIAAKLLLEALDNMTPDEFARGHGSSEMRLLREVIAKAEEGA